MSPLGAARRRSPSHTKSLLLPSPADFFIEGWIGLVFFYDYLRGRLGTRAPAGLASQGPLDIDAAFLGVGSDQAVALKAVGNESYDSSIAGETYRMQDVSQTELEMEKGGRGEGVGVGEVSEVGYYTRPVTVEAVRYEGAGRDTQQRLDPKYAYGEAR